MTRPMQPQAAPKVKTAIPRDAIATASGALELAHVVSATPAKIVNVTNSQILERDPLKEWRLKRIIRYIGYRKPII
jgi:hypothetical protein